MKGGIISPLLDFDACIVIDEDLLIVSRQSGSFWHSQIVHNCPQYIG